MAVFCSSLEKVLDNLLSKQENPLPLINFKERIMMFGFAKRKEDPSRKALREEFETVITTLRSTDNLVQVAVGNSIKMANSIFHQAYSSPGEFQRLPKSERISYINILIDIENQLREKKIDRHAALGFRLFKMWVGAVAELDSELMQQFGKELAHFTKKNDLPI